MTGIDCKNSSREALVSKPAPKMITCLTPLLLSNRADRQYIWSLQFRMKVPLDFLLNRPR
jgi:hypothetical protein